MGGWTAYPGHQQSALMASAPRLAKLPWLGMLKQYLRVAKSEGSAEGSQRPKYSERLSNSARPKMEGVGGAYKVQ